ncbi:MAG: HAMP domain-containing histidine kinase [Candidatus Gastranaerophilales bacterium]|nr:HAMP domain-containing histidine kinase [Candidatus Gastranaerophilales bacterium]
MRRLKIVEQIIIVLVLAVLIPFVTMGLIINNVSQQSIRSELANNTNLMASFIGNAIENYVNFSQSQLNQMASGFKYIPETMEKVKYFDEIEAKTKLFKNLNVIEKDELPKDRLNIEEEIIVLVSPINSKFYLSAEIKTNIIPKLFDNNLKRGIYVFDAKTQKLITTNTNKTQVGSILQDFNAKNFKDEKSGLFGRRKNTPKAFYRMSNPDWIVIVDTTKEVTKKTITKARIRILLSLCLSALFIFIMVGLYTTYLYINVRQLFKGITAISKGNYDKKIHLLKTIFTPFELVFLAKEFNYMANKVNVSYKDLRKKNEELEQLNEFREHLVSATSHEFRTPLTSIIGYTSRLLRNDIVVDNEMKVKSLQIIKQQAQRLSKMVDDLLVIPELESYSLKFNIEEVDLAESINQVAEYLKNDNVEFQLNIANDLNYAYVDMCRLEQVLINLIDNAIKYNLDNAPIKIEAQNVNSIPTIKIINKCEKISPEMKEKLFDKFIRVDSELTRTTRGTGLGLYIVKGLCEAMKIKINLEVDDEFAMILEFSDYVK